MRNAAPSSSVFITTMWEDAGGYTMPCRCGAALCRGVVANFPTLPAELRARYLALGIVQRFIVERTTNRVGI